MCIRDRTKGKFPTWLAPTQVKVLPVSEKTLDIGLSSRALKDDEKNDVDGTTVALDGIAIIVSKDSKVADPVSYTHLDVYKRQALQSASYPAVPECALTCIPV